MPLSLVTKILSLGLLIIASNMTLANRVDDKQGLNANEQVSDTADIEIANIETVDIESQPTAPSAPILRPKDFRAIYKAKFSGFSIEASRELHTLPNKQQQLSFRASTWLAKLNETSRFSWGDLGQLIPRRYEYHRSGLGKPRDAVLDFDWARLKVVNNVQAKPWSMTIPELTLDKLSYQLQLRSDLLNGKQSLQYDIADGGRLKTYLFEMVGEEMLQTRLGKLATVKIKKIRSTGKKRTTYIWMAKNWDYLLVKLQQTENNGKTYAIHLLSAEIDGETVLPRLGLQQEFLPTPGFTPRLEPLPEKNLANQILSKSTPSRKTHQQLGFKPAVDGSLQQARMQAPIQDTQISANDLSLALP